MSNWQLASGVAVPKLGGQVECWSEWQVTDAPELTRAAVEGGPVWGFGGALLGLHKVF